jgi:drug/metabolite transporter (DMT)-like permease
MQNEGREATRGWINGFIGVAIFSASLPATRLAVADIDPLFVTSARASIAAFLAFLLLRFFKLALPARQHLFPLFVVASGVVLGFPLFTALALQTITSAHSIVFIGLLPLATAIFGVVRAGERPTAAFWLFAAFGSACVVGYASYESAGELALGDAYMFAAIVVCGLGYAEGARLSRDLGGWQVISWALLLASPAMVALALWYWPSDPGSVGTKAWLGLAYVSVFSMLIGFFFWYRGLAQGGIAAVGQLQLLQPFMGLGLAAWLMDETVSWHMLAVSALVVACVAGSRTFGKRPAGK